MADAPTHPSSLEEEVASVAWYHTIELPGGRTTAGWYDTPRAMAKVPFPPSLAGKRCLDVGTCDGFWAFAMEQRGARETMGVDLADPGLRDWPGGVEVPPGHTTDRARRAFEIAKRALGSGVERRDLSIYDLSPDAVGRFDFVFVGALLLHVRDPVGALMAARSVLADGGELMCVDAVSLVLSLLVPFLAAASLSSRPIPRWWTPNVRGLRREVHRAGFEVVAGGGPFWFPFGKGHLYPKLRSARSPSGLGKVLAAQFFHHAGAPMAWVKARPL